MGQRNYLNQVVHQQLLRQAPAFVSSLLTEKSSDNDPDDLQIVIDKIVTKSTLPSP